MKVAVRIALIVISVCVPPSLRADTLVTGTIGSSTTWTAAASPYVMTGSVTIASGATLSIEPGVTVKSNDTYVLDVFGTLSAPGTSTNGIVFTSNDASPAAGAWAGLLFESGTAPSASRLSYVTVSYGGASNGASIRVSGSSPQFDHLSISTAAGAGIYVSGGAAPSIDTSTITSCGTYGINVDLNSTATVTNTTFSNNGNYALSVAPDGTFLGLSGLSASGNGGGAKDAIEQRGGSIHIAAVWHTTGGALPWIVTGTCSFWNSASLTIDPGVTAKFGAATELDFNSPTKLTTVGTSASPITLTSSSASPAAGAWNGIYLMSGSSALSQISYTTMAWSGGGNGGALRIDNVSPHVDHLTITNSGSAGINVTGNASPAIDSSTITSSSTYGLNVNGGSPAVTNTTFTSNGNYAISVAVDASVLGLTGLSASGNGGGTKDAIEQRGGSMHIAAHWSASALPWLITGTVSFWNSASLTIDPGTIVKFAAATEIDFTSGTKLTSVGTSASPITLTSSSASPAAGAWNGIYLMSASSALSQISYTTVAWSGGGNGGALRIDNVSPHVDHLTITNSGSAGINVTGNASPAIDSSTITSSSTYGVNVNGGSPAVTNTTFTSNGNYAISVAVDASALGLTGLSASGNGGGTKDAIEQRGGSMHIAAHWGASALPWLITGTVSFWNSASLTIDPGTTVKFAVATEIDFNSGTKLTAVGTSASPITLTSSSASPAAGAWNGIYLISGSSALSQISYTTIAWSGGGNGGAVRVDSASPQFDHLTITNSGSAGINVTGTAAPMIDTSTISGCTSYGVNVNAGTRPTITNTTFTNNGNYAISVNIDATALGLAGLAASGNGGGTKDGIEQRGGSMSIAARWSASPIPWIVTGTVSFWNSASLTIDPGVTAKFATGTELDFNSPTQLTAIGTGAAPITLTSSNATPAAGAWNGIYLLSGSSSLTRMSYATIAWAGGGTNGGALRVDNTSPQFDHLTITSSSSSAFRSTTAGAPVCSNCQFLASASGVTTTGTAAPDVRNSFWGASSGPSGLGPGSGLSVAGSATAYEPWLTAAPTVVQFYSGVAVLNRTFNPGIATATKTNFTTSLSGDWTETVKDGSSNVVRTLTGSGTSGSAVWDGTDGNGVTQPNGTYTYDLASTATSGAAAPLHGRVIIDSTKVPAVSNASEAPPYFSPNGDGVQDVATATATVNFDDAAWTARVKDSGGTVIRTVSLSQSGAMSFPWDGKDDSGVIEPDGNYTIDCVAVAGTASSSATVSVVLDNTFPSIAVASPPGPTISNIDQGGNASPSVTGSVSDSHLTNWTLDYGTGASPASWTTISTGTTAISNAQLGVWQTLALTNGAYTLRLQAWDAAGNRSVITNLDNVGNFKLTSSTYQMNTATGQTMTATSTVPFPVTETLVLKNLGGAVVRTLFNGTRNAGTYTDTWNGRNDGGAIVADGPYFTSATVTDASNSAILPAIGPTLNGWGDYYHPIQSSPFDPFNNQPLALTYSFALPGKVTVFMSTASQPLDACDPPNYCVVRDVYQPSGTFTVYWSGVDDTGALRTDLPYAGAGSIRTPYFDTSVTIAYGTVPSVSPPTVTPPYYGPAFGAQTLATTVSSYQSQPVNVAVTYKNQASGSILRTISRTSVAPGTITLTWDGRSDDGFWVAPGVYIVTATVTDGIGNSVTRQILTNVSY